MSIGSKVVDLKQTQVEESLTDLEIQLNIFEGCWKALQGRLESVLKPEEDQEKTIPDPPTLVGLALRINSVTKRIKNLNIENVFLRLEL